MAETVRECKGKHAARRPEGAGRNIDFRSGLTHPLTMNFGFSYPRFRHHGGQLLAGI